MSEQNNNHKSPEHNVAHDNVEHNDSILEETMQEFDPKNNSAEKVTIDNEIDIDTFKARIACLLYTSPSPRDRTRSRMPSSA